MGKYSYVTLPQDLIKIAQKNGTPYLKGPAWMLLETPSTAADYLYEMFASDEPGRNRYSNFDIEINALTGEIFPFPQSDEHLDMFLNEGIMYTPMLSSFINDARKGNAGALYGLTEIFISYAYPLKAGKNKKFHIETARAIFGLMLDTTQENQVLLNKLTERLTSKFQHALADAFSAAKIVIHAVENEKELLKSQEKISTPSELEQKYSKKIEALNNEIEIKKASLTNIQLSLNDQLALNEKAKTNDQKYKIEINKLSDENKSLNTRLRTITSQFNDTCAIHNNRTNSLIADLSNARQSIATLNQNNRYLSGTVAALATENNEQKRNFENSEMKYIVNENERSAEANRLTKQLGEVSKMFTLLSLKNAAFIKTIDDMKANQTTHSTASRQLPDSYTQVATVKDDNIIKNKNNELSESNDKLTNENKELKKRNEELTTRYNKIAYNNAPLQAEIENLKHDLGNKNNELKKNTDESNKRINELTKSTDDSNKKYDKIKKDYDTLLIEHNSMKSNNDSVKSNNNKTKEDNDKLISENKVLEDKNVKLSETIESLKNDKNKLNDEKNKTERTISEKNSKLQSEYDKLKSELNKTKKEKNNIEGKLQLENEKIKNEVDSFKREKKDFGDNLSSDIETISSNFWRITGKKDTVIAGLQSQNEALIKKLKEVADENGILKKDNVSLANLNMLLSEMEKAKNVSNNNNREVNSSKPSASTWNGHIESYFIQAESINKTTVNINDNKAITELAKKTLHAIFSMLYTTSPNAATRRLLHTHLQHCTQWNKNHSNQKITTTHPLWTQLSPLISSAFLDKINDIKKKPAKINDAIINALDALRDKNGFFGFTKGTLLEEEALKMLNMILEHHNIMNPSEKNRGDVSIILGHWITAASQKHIVPNALPSDKDASSALIQHGLFSYLLTLLKPLKQISPCDRFDDTYRGILREKINGELPPVPLEYAVIGNIATVTDAILFLQQTHRVFDIFDTFGTKNEDMDLITKFINAFDKDMDCLLSSYNIFFPVSMRLSAAYIFAVQLQFFLETIVVRTNGAIKFPIKTTIKYHALMKQLINALDVYAPPSLAAYIPYCEDITRMHHHLVMHHDNIFTVTNDKELTSAQKDFYCQWEKLLSQVEVNSTAVAGEATIRFISTKKMIASQNRNHTPKITPEDVNALEARFTLLKQKSSSSSATQTPYLVVGSNGGTSTASNTVKSNNNNVK